MPKRITIKDLAKKLDIHHSTVSRALRNHPKVKEETRTKIMEAAQLFGYQVNMNALLLRGDINNTIALIVPNIRHLFFTNIISHLTNLAHKHGFVISIFESNEKFEQEQEIVNTIIRYNFSGVIASIAKNTMNHDHFQLLKNYDIPLVFFDRVCEELDCPMVLINNYQSAFDAAELLIRKGYRKIAHLSGPVHLNVFRERQKGYIDALSKNKLGYQNLVIVNKEFTINDGKVGLMRMLEHSEKPDAVISSSSLLSIGILLQAKKEGITIPDDLALIGFGDHEFADILEPGITCIIQPEDEIARNAFELMHYMLTKENGIEQTMIRHVQTRIIYRNSI